MADLKLNSITFPGIADRYILDSGHVEYDATETYSDGTVGKALNDKANINGYYENLGSGYADNLATDIRAEGQTPYNFQTAGGSVDIGDREYLNAVVGGSLPINQIFKARTIGSAGITFTASNDGKTETIDGTATSAAYCNLSTMPASIKGHVYYVNQDKANASFQIYNDNKGISTLNKVETVGKSTGNTNFYIRVESGATLDNVSIDPQVIDLTLLLGPSIADYIYTLEQATTGAGVAWCKAHFPKIFNAGYLAHNAGTMEHVTGVSSHDTIGFNQWDEQWENGRISTSTGATTSGNGIISKNHIKILSSTAYHIKSGTYGDGTAIRIFYYDADKKYISYISNYGMSGNFTTPVNACYIRFNIQTTNVMTAYNLDICINLAWDNSRNGEYESYTKRTYPLDSSLTLRGVPKLDASNNLYYDGDVYAYDGTVTRRYGIVDLSTLNWSKSSRGNMFYADLSDAVTFPTPGAVAGNVIGNLVCSKYATDTCNNTYNITNDKTIGGGNWNSHNYLQVVDSAYSDATTFKNSLSGVYLNYELATPTTESADPFQQVQIVDDFGTEEFVTSGIIPVGHSSEYPVNLKAKLEMTPDSPSGGNGDYVVQQASGINTYVPLGSTDTITGIIARLEALENA